MNREKLIIDLLSHENYIPMKKKEIAILLDLNKEEKKELDEVLESLLNKGKIMITKRGKIMINTKPPSLFVGTFRATERGFGFVELGGFSDDFFIPAKFTMNALDGDIVKIEKLPRSTGRRTEAKVIKILTRTKDTFIGSYESSEDFGFVVCDDKKMKKDIFVRKKNSLDAKKGQKVVVKVFDFGNNDKKPEGEVIEILGYANDPDIAILSLLRELNIPTQFPDEVLQELRELSYDDELEKRKDFRDLVTVTIDGADAKDLDDAISIEKLDNGYRLYVHIADVSHYVRAGSELDKEAVKRGTSVYLVDKVVPMLPKGLSNELCSLNKNEDKLALSVRMDINEKARVVDYKIYESIVSINERMTYDAVYRILEGEDEYIKKYNYLLNEFKMMEELAKILRKNRKKRGSIDFNLKETKVELDENGKVVNIDFYKTTFANKIIEEFMLITNEVIAEHFYWQEIPFVFRNHEEPDPEKIKQLATFIRAFGYTLKGSDELHPKAMQKLLVEVEGSEEEILISRISLRSMQQAKYESENKGHFGLAAKFYCHFTSPIRRYPDLIIHRIIKDSINGRIDSKKIQYYKGILAKIALECSKNERRAITAEREVIKMKVVEYMADKIGLEYDGIVSGITGWGMYVELANSVEGMIRLENIRDDIYYSDDNYNVIGVNSGRRFTLGDKLRISVTKVDKETNKIDFDLI